LRDLELPFFPGRVSAYPYLSLELERLARDLGLAEASWYSVFDGQFVLQALARSGSGVSEDPLEAAAAIVRASELDVFGREPYQLFVVQLDGHAAGEPVSRTLVLRATEPIALTGTVTALAARAVLEGEVAPGARFAADALDPLA